jgi:4-alpha-glucanotransferase
VGAARLRERVVAAAGVTPDAPLDEVIEALHRRLAASPAILVATTLEDALRVAERPNLPGTVQSQRNNWSLSLPVPLEELGGKPRVASLVESLRRRSR